MTNLALALLFFLSVVVVYDPDKDGNQQGVGLGVPVTIREVGEEAGDIALTDKFSGVFFSISPGTYRIQSFPKSTRLFFVWVCDETMSVDDDNDTVVLQCVERFFIHFPWLNRKD